MGLRLGLFMSWELVISAGSMRPPLASGETASLIPAAAVRALPPQVPAFQTEIDVINSVGASQTSLSVLSSSDDILWSEGDVLFFSHFSLESTRDATEDTFPAVLAAKASAESYQPRPIPDNGARSPQARVIWC